MIVQTHELKLPKADVWNSRPSPTPLTGSLGLSLAVHALAILIVLAWPVSSSRLPTIRPSEHIPLIAPSFFRPELPRVSHRRARTGRIAPVRSARKSFHVLDFPPITTARRNVLPEVTLPDLELDTSALPPVESPRLTLPKPPPSTNNLTEAQVVTPTATAYRAATQTMRFASAETTTPNLSQRSMTSSSFGDAKAATPQARPASANPSALASAVEILFKPRPVYTEEARRLRIEGEVLLEVLFAATGEIHISKLVRGLGHGLDETAGNAARQIRFRPAQRNGAPVDSLAVVHIVFELAY